MTLIALIDLIVTLSSPDVFDWAQRLSEK